MNKQSVNCARTAQEAGVSRGDARAEGMTRREGLVTEASRGDARAEGMPHRTALVTGASRGIGRAIARELAAQGWDLILTCSKSMTELEELGEELRGKERGAEPCGEDDMSSEAPEAPEGWQETGGVRVRCELCDMGNPDDVRKLFQEIRSLDLLVNNAGISHIGLLQEMTDAEWDRIIAVNLSSVFYTSRAAIPIFVRQGSGRIINISSVWGNAGASCEVAYSASKGGVNAFTKALAKELAPCGIAVNAIACGCVDTSMNAHLQPQDRADLEEAIPAGRFAAPGEVAKAVANLADMPAYLTGQVITIDGGWT